MTAKKILYRFGKFRRRLGTRVVFYVLVSIFTAVLALYLGPYVPDATVDNLGKIDVEPLLQSLSGSMLTISTFALSTIVAANSNAVANTTPRAFKLLLEDQGSQTVLARFLGAFVFSVIALLLIPLGLYTGGGRIVLLFFTVGFVILIVVTFVRWVAAVRELGSMSYALAKIEAVTNESLRSYFRDPLQGCNYFNEASVDYSKLTATYGDNGKFVTLIDETGLQLVAEKYDIEIYVNALEGDFVTYRRPIFYIKGDASEKAKKDINSMIYFDRSRDIMDDPRHGFTMIYQTASKALSPGINDPGTAISCLQAAFRLFRDWQDPIYTKKTKDRVWKRRFDLVELQLSFFEPIVHDGGDSFLVQSEVMMTLSALYYSNGDEMKKATAITAAELYQRICRHLISPLDVERVTEIYEQSFGSVQKA